MKNLKGLGTKSRQLLSKVLRKTKGTITPDDVAQICELSKPVANVYLARWTENGWLNRVKRGLYVPVPLESNTATPILEDPWVVASRLFEPCYICGLSAAQYWDFTEQMFQSTFVCTQKEVRKIDQVLGKTRFVIRRVQKSRFFGLTTVWRDGVKVQVADPTRTIIDFMHLPRMGGGIQLMEEMFCAYMQSKNCDLKCLLNYAKQMRNSAIFKRLGFLCEKNFPQKKKFLTECQRNINKKFAKLDPNINCDILCSKWRLWVPKGLVDD